MVSLRQGKQALLAVACGLTIFFLYHAITGENLLGQFPTVPLYPSSELGEAAVPNADTLIPPSGSGFAATTIPRGAYSHGFTLFDQLYLRNGTFYVLTSDPLSFPPRRTLIAPPLEIGRGHSLEPTDQELRFIDPEDAKYLLGDHVIRIEDLTVILYDPDQFMHHYYHWWGEIILGFWRVYSKLAFREDGSVSPLPFPARFLVPFVGNGTWRDKAGVDGPLMRAAFPNASIQAADYWQDLLKLNVSVVFERAMVINRDTAHRHPFGSLWYKMIAGTMNVTVPDGFWEPVRESMVKNLLGYIPVLDHMGAVRFPPQALSSRPLVTYVSRQGHGRRLLEKDHQGLVQALMELQSEGLCDVQVVAMERLSLREQVDLVARSTVLVGVHGNGLTHQLWMPPSLLSTTIEIFIPEGYVFDYEILARNMGHKHYAVWNDTFLTYPKGSYNKGVNYPTGFHGVEIPVHGPTVAQILRERLTPDEGGGF